MGKSGADIPIHEKGIELWRHFAIEIPKTRSTSFLCTHPAAPERILRVKNVMEMIKAGHEDWDYVDKETGGD